MQQKENNLHQFQSEYPIIDSEFGRRFFDRDLIEAIIEADKDFFLSAQSDEYLRKWIKSTDQKPMDWDSMSLKEQISAQIGFVAPMPRSLNSNLTDAERETMVASELESERKWAERVHKEILEILQRHGINYDEKV